MKFSISYPIKPWVVTQPFGVNGDYYQAHGIPIKGHNGLDVKASHGQPIYAAHDGVAYYETDENQGHGVVIHSDQQYDGDTGPCYFKSIYWHMCDSKKEPQFISPIEGTNGLPVKEGDLIGYADSTGLSTGDHLHFSIKPEAKTGEAPGAWYNLQQDNGYLGCLDATPYFNGLYAQDIEVDKKAVTLVSEVIPLINQVDASHEEKMMWYQILANFLKKLFG